MLLSNRRASTLILCLMVFAAVFVLTCPFDSDGDFAEAAVVADCHPCLADVLSWDVCSACALVWARPDCDGTPLHAPPATRLSLHDQGLLAAVPGGLCLLI